MTTTEGGWNWTPKVLSKEEKDAITEHCSAVWSALPTRLWPKPQVAPVTEAQMKKWFATLQEHCWSSDRHYHTLKHVHSLLRVHHVDQVAAAAKRFNDTRTAVKIDAAIFFHDVIYDPKASDNEEKSAELWRKFSTEVKLLEPKEVEQVSAWILSTKKHGGHPSGLKESDPDLALFLDFDLSVLAAPEAEYKEYAAGIRAEYAHVPEEEYRKRRTEVLKGFLAAERLYLTEPFHRIFESKARGNITNEIQALEASSS